MIPKKYKKYLYLSIILIILFLIILYLLKYKIELFNNQNNFDNISGIVYINLFYRTDRNDSILDIFKRLNIPKEKINKINAYIVPLNGHKGCSRSHMDAIDFAKKNNWDNVMIFEDDIKINDDQIDLFKMNLQKILDIFKHKQIKWDVIMLGTTVSEKQDTDYDPMIKKIIDAKGSWAYIVNKNYFDKLYDIYNKSYTSLQIDNTIDYDKYALDRIWSGHIKENNWFGFNNEYIDYKRNYESSSDNGQSETLNYNDQQLKKIPKKIHQIWVGSNPDDLPIHKKKYMDSFKIINNDWEYKIWTDKDITLENFPITYQYLDIINKMTDKGKYAKLSDLMRYEILFNHGGFYFDTNIELLNKINKIIPDFEQYKFIICHESKDIETQKKYLSNGFFACVNKNKYLGRILNDIVLRIIDYNQAANNVTGPKLFAQCFKEEDYKDQIIKLLDTEIIYPVHWSIHDTDKCIKSDINNLDNNFIITSFKHNKYGIKYPCDQYPNSLAIDHFKFGGSWL